MDYVFSIYTRNLVKSMFDRIEDAYFTSDCARFYNSNDFNLLTGGKKVSVSVSTFHHIQLKLRGEGSFIGRFGSRLRRREAENTRRKNRTKKETAPSWCWKNDGCNCSAALLEICNFSALMRFARLRAHANATRRARSLSRLGAPREIERLETVHCYCWTV